MTPGLKYLRTLKCLKIFSSVNPFNSIPIVYGDVDSMLLVITGRVRRTQFSNCTCLVSPLFGLVLNVPKELSLGVLKLPEGRKKSDV